MNKLQLFINIQNGIEIKSEPIFRNSNFIGTKIPELEKDNAIVRFYFSFHGKESTKKFYKSSSYNVEIHGSTKEIENKFNLFKQRILQSFDSIEPVLRNKTDWYKVESLFNEYTPLFLETKKRKNAKSNRTNDI